MKILDIKVSGYKMLPDNFEINLVPRIKVLEKDLETEIAEIDDKLYSFSTISFVGSNSSGKTTILRLIEMSQLLITNGEIIFNPEDFNEDVINLTIYFYFNGYIYKYECTLEKPILSLNINDVRSYCVASNEKIFRKEYIRTVKKELLENINETFKLAKEDKSIVKYLAKMINSFEGDMRPIFFPAIGSGENILKVFLLYKQSLSPILISYFISILDDSIEKIEPINNNKNSGDFYTFKRKNHKERTISLECLVNILSSGTIKGLLLYLYSYITLLYGSSLIVDEIERSFHKDLVDNIILLFNDADINVNHSTLIFSTHYLEIIDTINRRDSIFVMHKNDSIISADNMYDKYPFRNELSKSNQYNSNAFNTHSNYETLMKIKNLITEDIQKKKK